MKRFVCVPSSFEDAPIEATKLAAESQLSIRVDEDVDVVCIKSFPEDEFTDCMDEVKAGFIHATDITNEFIDFTPTTHMLVMDLKFEAHRIKPMVITKHSLRFRSRFNVLGLHKFCIVDDDNKTYYKGEFTVV